MTYFFRPPASLMRRNSLGTTTKWAARGFAEHDHKNGSIYEPPNTIHLSQGNAGAAETVNARIAILGFAIWPD